MMMEVPASYAKIGGAPARMPPLGSTGVLARLHKRYFATPLMSVVTVVLAAIIVWALTGLFRWAIWDAVWYAPEGTACRDAAGACWAVITEKHRVMLFGAFPYEEQWRGAVIIALWLVWGVLTATRLFAVSLRLLGWLVIFVATIALLRGGIFGMPHVGTDLWGGLPLTFLIFGGTVAGGLPLAILLALGRRSQLPAIRFLSIATIECVRGIPLLVVLFFAALILPLFLPPQLNVDKLVRAEIGMIIFFAAYAAEVVRGGLQALPDGQEEAAKALGLRYWQRMRKIVLPQALAISIPALFNDIIRAFKNTTFFAILGLFDVLGATKAALQDPNWVRYGLEGYLFVFLLYFLICSGMSLYGRSLEHANASRGRKVER
ncbi:general L-amino acid transport system permease protein [Rhodopseudomonas julia]|uniref:General L-amino acid transport system permease protein n=1 Tax=Rhodopseudomonas julia TaxID=200617 RepID=A0ABU0C171_9BRAD|nr:amino acid ABC transporter permease [Rhodopseudomonas julia]MDQ0324270.1 general L-amino acid transport system permease protein [Rhodopseudomonas julia]